MAEQPHVLVNGLSVGGGGGYTVARELLRNMAAARSEWRFTMALITGKPLHEAFKAEPLPSNCRLHWAPTSTRRRGSRLRWEWTSLVRWCREERVTAVLQPNGMVVSRLRLPTISHNQDPWPYRPEAWDGWRHRVLAMLKRRGHARALRRADIAGWTSRYLERLVCDAEGITPKRSEIFPNGVPDEWIERAQHGVPEWAPRPMEIVTVSNVNHYKRQSLAIRAVAMLVRRPGTESLRYRIVGECSPQYQAELRSLAQSLGIADRVIMEGRVADERVQEALASARAFVLMSVCESFGIPAIEAMTFGTPVVVADCCAIPEVCGDAAALVPMDDLDSLVESLHQILTDEQRAVAMQNDGVRRVANFRWSATGERMAACFDDLQGLSERRNPS